MGRIRFILATRGEFFGLDELLDDSDVQESLIAIRRKIIGLDRLPMGGRRLLELGLITDEGLAFPIVLEEEYRLLRRDIEALGEEVSGEVEDALVDSVDSMEERCAAVLGELDAALDAALVEEQRLRPLRLMRGEAFICGFEGARGPALTSECHEIEGGLRCMVQYGEGGEFVRATLGRGSAASAESPLMMELADRISRLSVERARLWAGELGFTGSKVDLFAYGFSKLVYESILTALSQKGFIPGAVRIEYVVLL